MKKNFQSNFLGMLAAAAAALLCVVIDYLTGEAEP